MTTLRIEIQVGPAPNPGGNATITFTPSGQLIEVGESQYVTEQGPLPAGTGLGTVTVSPPETELGVISTDGAVALFGVGQYRSLQAVQELAEGVWLIDVTDEAPVPPDPPDPSEGLLVTITSAAGTFSFAEADGYDLGTWRDPRGRFLQTHTRVTHADLPDFWVDCVRDSGGDWASVEFRAGTAGKPANTGSYSVTVTGDFAGQASTPDHWWGARWRMSGNAANGLRPGGNDWPYEPTPYATLLDERLIPDFDPVQTGQASTVSAASPQTVIPYTPMGASSFTTQMGAGGARPDICLFNDWDAFALSSLAPTAGPELVALRGQLLTNVRTMAEAACSIPQSPMAPGTDHIYRRTPGDPNILWGEASAPCPWKIDTPHAPEIGYVAYILWRDPWDLDTCQRGTLGLYYYGDFYRIFQVRQHAWDYRSALLAWRATPDDAPSWLLPKSTFDVWINAIQDFAIASYIDGAREPGALPVSTTFHAVEAANMSNGYNVLDTAGNIVIWQMGLIMPWQNAYVGEATCLGVYLRPDDAKARRLAEFTLTHLDEQSNGQTGWAPSALPVYYLPVSQGHGGAPYFASWGECWGYWCQILGNTNPDGSINPIPPDYVCAPAPATPQFDATKAVYPGLYASALSLAVQAGLDFRAARDWWQTPVRTVGYVEAGRAWKQV